MAPPEAPATRAGTTPPRESLCITVLKKRSDFVALNRARRQVMPTLLVQGRDRQDGTDAVRVGFTCSRKVGNAVARNRAKRRLREVARKVLPEAACEGWDYALIGRAEVTGAYPFEDLIKDLQTALRKLHGRT